LLRRETLRFDPQATLAALVVDNRERRVIAYVGNADFDSRCNGMARSTWRARCARRDRR
jgi:membrane carboxypeptidase/penicillin-binding protein PbpC